MFRLIAVLSAAIATAVALQACEKPSQPAAPTATASAPTSPKQTYGSQTVLPFTGIARPMGVAVDSGGTVYFADGKNHRVLELPISAPAPTALPITGLTNPTSVAVDNSGTLYITDQANNIRVLKVAAGSSTPTELPFTGLTGGGVDGVAIDGTGNVYIAAEGPNSGQDRVLKLPAG
jgi:streptogramin lyase